MANRAVLKVGRDHQRGWGSAYGSNPASSYLGEAPTTVVRIAELFRPAIVANAASIILTNCRSSGDPTPSPEDVRVTAEAVKAGQLLDIDVLDHVVIGKGA